MHVVFKNILCMNRWFDLKRTWLILKTKVDCLLFLFDFFSQWYSEGMRRFFILHLFLHGTLPQWAGEMSPAGHARNGGIWQDSNRPEKVGVKKMTYCREHNIYLKPIPCWVFFLVWLQHCVDSSEDCVEDWWPHGFLPRTHIHLSEGDTRLLLLLWGLWNVSD